MIEIVLVILPLTLGIVACSLSYKAGKIQGRIEGLDMAIDMLEEARREVNGLLADHDKTDQRDGWGIKEDYCVFGIRPKKEVKNESANRL